MAKSSAVKIIVTKENPEIRNAEARFFTDL